MIDKLLSHHVSSPPTIAVGGFILVPADYRVGQRHHLTVYLTRSTWPEYVSTNHAYNIIIDPDFPDRFRDNAAAASSYDFVDKVVRVFNELVLPYLPAGFRVTAGLHTPLADIQHQLQSLPEPVEPLGIVGKRPVRPASVPTVQPAVGLNDPVPVSASPQPTTRPPEPPAPIPNLPHPPVTIDGDIDPLQLLDYTERLWLDRDGGKSVILLVTRRAPTAPWEAELIHVPSSLDPNAIETKDAHVVSGSLDPVTSRLQDIHVFTKRAGIPSLEIPTEHLHVMLPQSQAERLQGRGVLSVLDSVKGSANFKILGIHTRTSTHVPDTTTLPPPAAPETVPPVTDETPATVGSGQHVTEEIHPQLIAATGEHGELFRAYADESNGGYLRVELSHPEGNNPLFKIFTRDEIDDDSHVVNQYTVVWWNGEAFFHRKFTEEDVQSSKHRHYLSTVPQQRQYIFVKLWGQSGLWLTALDIPIEVPGKDPDVMPSA